MKYYTANHLKMLITPKFFKYNISQGAFIEWKTGKLKRYTLGAFWMELLIAERQKEILS